MARRIAPFLSSLTGRPKAGPFQEVGCYGEDVDASLRRWFLSHLGRDLELVDEASWAINKYDHGPYAWLLFRANYRRPRLRPVRVEQVGPLLVTAEDDGLPVLTQRAEDVPAAPRPPRKLSPEAAEFIRTYQREDPSSVLAVFWRYHSLEAEEFDTVEEAERFLESGEEYGSLGGEAVVDGDRIKVCI